MSVLVPARAYIKIEGVYAEPFNCNIYYHIWASIRSRWGDEGGGGGGEGQRLVKEYSRIYSTYLFKLQYCKPFWAVL